MDFVAVMIGIKTHFKNSFLSAFDRAKNFGAKFLLMALPDKLNRNIYISVDTISSDM